MRPPFRSLARDLDLEAEPESESPSRRAVLRGGDADPSFATWSTVARSEVNAFDCGRSNRVKTSAISNIHSQSRLASRKGNHAGLNSEMLAARLYSMYLQDTSS